MAIRSLSLCSGVGMLDEGVRAAFEHAGLEYRTVCHVERDAYAAAVLVARMEDAALDQAPVWADLTTFDAGRWRGAVDCVVAGFPCQPWSVAGKRAGTGDARWLWPAIARIIHDIRPRYVCLENVPGLVSGGGLWPVLSSLHALWFDAEWLSIAAGQVGASHKRERVFILAYRAERGRGELREPSGGEGQPDGHGAALADAGRAGIRDENEQERQRWRGRAARAGFGSEALADTRSEQRDEGTESAHVLEHEPRARAEGRGAVERPGQAVAIDEQPPAQRSLFAPGPTGEWAGVPRWLHPAVEPGVRVLADGLALVVDQGRADQLRCAGNGVVALQAAVAFSELLRRMKVEHYYT